MDVRRVVTGHDERGHAVFASDETVSSITVDLVPGWEFHRLWGNDATASFPDGGKKPEAELYFPPTEGFRFAFFTIPPSGANALPDDLDVDAALAEFRERLPGMAEHLEAEHPGMHTTATVDVGVVLSGEATLELDDGAKVVLKAGDSYVQNGTRHRWSNHGQVPAVVAVTLIGARNDNVG